MFKNNSFKDYENDVYYKLSEYFEKKEKIEKVFVILLKKVRLHSFWRKRDEKDLICSIRRCAFY